jgi:glycosyltransferase involved in cell wall biosynthesis
MIVALDLPIQGTLYNQIAPMFARPKGDTRPAIKYIAITPLENGPLCMTWAVPLFNMDKVFFISELGKVEAEKVGLSNVEHLFIGVDTVSWHPATPEEKSKLREGLGIPQDAFVVLTVADNQERKNLWAGLRSISILKSLIDRPIRYVLVTREHNPYGYKMRDLIHTEGVKEECILFERGMPVENLWGLYAASDCYLQPSKAEGLGLPVLDAMASGLPVVATDTGALRELLEDGRGYLIPADYEFTDVWGNSLRSMISVSECAKTLKELSLKDTDVHQVALPYARSRTWDIPAKQFDDSIRRMFNE